MMRFTVFICFVFFSVQSRAQNKLFLCTSYDSTGKYSGQFDTWNIIKSGNFMYIFLQSGEKLYDTVVINLEKTLSRRDTSFFMYDSWYLVPGPSGKWAVNKYIFSKPGTYRITAYNRNTEKLIASCTVSIDFSQETYGDPYFTDTWYYSGSRLAFCDTVVDGQMINNNTVFSSKPAGNNLTLYIENGNKKPLKSEHILARTYSQISHELIGITSYSLDRQWYWTFVPFYIKKPGKYSIELYNEDDVFINQTAVEIK